MTLQPFTARSGACFAVASGMLLGLVGHQILGMTGVFGLSVALTVLGIWTAEGRDTPMLEERDGKGFQR